MQVRKLQGGADGGVLDGGQVAAEGADVAGPVGRGRVLGDPGRRVGVVGVVVGAATRGTAGVGAAAQTTVGVKGPGVGGAGLGEGADHVAGVVGGGDVAGGAGGLGGDGGDAAKGVVDKAAVGDPVGRVVGVAGGGAGGGPVSQVPSAAGGLVLSDRRLLSASWL